MNSFTAEQEQALQEYRTTHNAVAEYEKAHNDFADMGPVYAAIQKLNTVFAPGEVDQIIIYTGRMDRTA